MLLLKGIVYKKEYPKEFFEIGSQSYGVISEYLQAIGLELIVCEEDGFAYLQSIVYEDEDEAPYKLLIPRELGYKVSLLCVLLRKKFTEFQMQNEHERAIISFADMTTMLSLFFAKRFDEVKLQKEMESVIKKVIALGFLKELNTDERSYEIQSAIKAFIDAQWLDDFDQKLKSYQEAKQWS